MFINKEQIMQFLPHRDPFLFLDSIDSISKEGVELYPGDVADNKETVGVEIQASFYVREDLEILKGHFPGNPILPGVVQVEMMAQTSCFVIPVRLLKPFEIDLKVAFMGIHSTKFRKPIIPGMKLKIHCICRKCRGDFNKPIMSYDCKIWHEDKAMSEATIYATVNY